MDREGGAMKVTTVRFGTDLWQMLEAEAALAGVSVSQYIREAALARAAAAAALRGEDPLRLLAGELPQAGFEPPVSEPTRQEPLSGVDARRRAAETRAELRATRAEAGQAIRRAHELAGRSAELRKHRD